MKPANNAPVYASIYRELAEVFRHFGYALAIHGSLARDFDLIAVPWSESPSSPQAVIAEIEQQFALKATGELTDKPHGRKCQTMVFAGGDTFLDLSFMPVNPDCPQCWGEGEVVPCGGCGAESEKERCIGCFHQFHPPTPPAPAEQKQ